jgi:hypothetical protein
MTVALMTFVRELLPEGDAALGVDATMNSYDILVDCLEDAKSTTPIFFALTPGNNVYENLDILAQYVVALPPRSARGLLHQRALVRCVLANPLLTSLRPLFPSARAPSRSSP